MVYYMTFSHENWPICLSSGGCLQLKSDFFADHEYYGRGSSNRPNKMTQNKLFVWILDVKYYKMAKAIFLKNVIQNS